MAQEPKTFSESQRNGSNGRQDPNHLNGRLEEHLLRTAVRRASAAEAKVIACDLDVPYSTMTAQLRRLVAVGKACHTYVINPFATRFCHEFLIGLRVDGYQISKRYAARHSDSGGSSSNPGQRRDRPVERFIDEVIGHASEDRQIAEHLIIIDAAILLGAHDHDVELSVVTDDGAYSVRDYVSGVLVAHPCVRTATTVTVGWRYRFDGYSGEYAHRLDGAALRAAVETSGTKETS